ncbi:MAG: sigma-54 dependent transcriptional regulator [Deltaproteobacteria bacterium]|jgi:two-component system response regulator HydG|nr:sigma-54 dependent transcriptional regulator [Deltaproteobacteria bacterium]
MPNAPKSKILVVEDDAGHRGMLLTLLADWGYRLEGAPDGEGAVALCRSQSFDLALMDVRMPGMSGIEALQEIKREKPDLPILIMTAYSDVKTAVEAIKAGAYDYLTKPLNFDELRQTMERALDHAALRHENGILRDALAASLDTGGIISQSPVMRKMMQSLTVIAPSEATVLITGESGTGKELVARAIHNNSSRRKAPFVAVNCAALAESLLESELFGHERGAFTGAESRRKGRFQSADTGTIFLDEIGEISAAMQSKLLRVVQEREIQPVGSDRTIKVDVRILAATCRDLARDVEQGRFRQDLFYRLNVVTLHLPPLRERTEDIPLLAAHFLKKFAEKNHKQVKGFAPAAMSRLNEHAWPGNVRELENAVERAVVLLAGEYAEEGDLPPALLSARPESAAPAGVQQGLTLEKIERQSIMAALEAARGNKSEAARRLGITRKTLHAKLQRYEE